MERQVQLFLFPPIPKRRPFDRSFWRKSDLTLIQRQEVVDRIHLGGEDNNGRVFPVFPMDGRRGINSDDREWSSTAAPAGV
jgi:hypothetical protein